MIGPLVAMPTPPPQPRRAPPKDTSASFLDCLQGNGTPPPAPPVAALQGNAVVGAQTNAVTVSPIPSSPVAVTSLPVPQMPPGLALRIEHHAGAVELIALPWRLMATGGLAHEFGLHSQGIQAGHAGTAARQARGLLSSTGAAAIAQVPADASGVFGIEAAAGFAAGAGIPVERFDATEAADVHVHAEAPVALPWVARLLRWLEEHGEATLWVRDFRLDEGDKRALVATLRTAAAQSGCRLDRIVINGRAHWYLHRPTREASHAS